MDGRICLVLLVAVTIVSCGPRPWINYACKANGDISVRVPNALPFLSVVSNNSLCTAAYEPYVANETGVYPADDESSAYNGTQTAFILITNCANETLEKDVTLELNVRFHPSFTGGYRSTIYNLGCMLEKDPNLVKLHVNASIVDATQYTSVDDPSISVTTRNLLGQYDFVYFTFGYPIFTEFIGPPSTSMIASNCTAYDTQHNKEHVLVTNGCTLDETLMTSFSSTVTDWTHRPSVEIKEETNILDTEMANTEGEGERPWMWADIKAFRFRTNKEVEVKCYFKVCLVGDPQCEMNCTTTEP